MHTIPFIIIVHVLIILSTLLCILYAQYYEYSDEDMHIIMSIMHACILRWSWFAGESHELTRSSRGLFKVESSPWMGVPRRLGEPPCK